ncbi:MAG TPA: hypothetical protein VN892_11560, partial [Solirubrobacteraceae bacterium]|nr:hypothetical protein [Solirubrobacteraceae bacterium]
MFAFGLAERDACIVGFDGCFYEVDGLVALGAFAALVARTDEVLVGAAVAFVSGVDELAAAGAAADGALEVVLVLAVALSRVAVGDEHGLDLVEQFLADQPLVPALVDVSLVGDVAGVVGVGQQSVDLRESQRLRTAPAGCACGQAAGLKQDRDVREAVQAGGVGLICPHDDRSALRVDRHGAHLAPVGQRLADVQVADGRQAVGAADLDLAFDAALDLLGDLDP